MLLLLCLGCAGEVQPELLPRMCVPWLYGLRLADYPGCCDAWLAAAGRCDHLMTLDLTNCNMVRGWARGVWEGGEGEGQGGRSDSLVEQASNQKETLLTTVVTTFCHMPILPRQHPHTTLGSQPYPL
jgi:hypothetical protein